MKKRLLVHIGLLACLLVVTAAAGPAFAGGGQSGFEPPPAGAIITGPEIWGVVTVYCSAATSNFATIRLKRVVDCNAETLTFADPNWNENLCPVTAEDATNLRVDLLQPTLENAWGVTGNPYIDTVRNFDRQIDQATDTSITSFDAMIKFWTQ